MFTIFKEPFIHIPSSQLKIHQPYWVFFIKMSNWKITIGLLPSLTLFAFDVAMMFVMTLIISVLSKCLASCQKNNRPIPTKRSYWSYCWLTPLWRELFFTYLLPLAVSFVLMVALDLCNPVFYSLCMILVPALSASLLVPASDSAIIHFGVRVNVFFISVLHIFYLCTLYGYEEITIAPILARILLAHLSFVISS